MTIDGFTLVYIYIYIYIYTYIYTCIGSSLGPLAFWLSLVALGSLAPKEIVREREREREQEPRAKSLDKRTS